MNKQQLRRDKILRHAFALQRYFLTDSSGSVLQIAKDLHRLENKAHRLAEDYCNGIIDTSDFEKKDKKLYQSLQNILTKHKATRNTETVFLNSDPRGYALKIYESCYDEVREAGIETDWGRYGILAPEIE